MFYDLTPFTSLDYPGKLACIVWSAGCNMKCQYCYNYKMITESNNGKYEELKSFLIKRKGLLDGIVFSGGECTLNPNLEKMIDLAKELNYLIKVDTNGSNPKVLEKIINKIDYVAMDFKAPKYKYKEIVNLEAFDKFEECLNILLKSNVEFEIRTTLHNDLLTLEDLNNMYQYLIDKGYKNIYYIQKFQEVDNLNNLKDSIKEYDMETFIQNKNIKLRAF